jgi:general secretion pathway protein K
MTRAPLASDKQCGFILIFAIGVCLMLALVGATMGRSVQAALRSTSTVIEIAKARSLADGGVAFASAWLQSAGGPAARICTVTGAGLIALTIEDEDGKVSLNGDNQALLSALFAGLGASQREAERYAAVIADYSDADSNERPDGAEADAYRAAGMAGIPKNANFDSVAELDRVLGIPAAIRSQAKLFLTASTSARGVDSEVAPQSLIQLLSQGASGQSAAFGEKDQLPASLSAVSSRNVYKVRVVGVTPQARFVREAIVARPPKPGDAMRILSWHQGEVTPDDEVRLKASDAAPEC